jgi:hypothetical protein
MEKIYCSNCNAELIPGYEYCPVCCVSLKPTAAVPEPTYTSSDLPAPTRQQEETKIIRISFIALGIFLIGLGVYLVILFPKFAIIIGIPVIIGLDFVYRIIAYGTLRRRKRRGRGQEPKQELTTGKKIGYLGILIFFSTLALALIASALKSGGGLTLFFLAFGFFVGFPLILVGGASVREEAKEKQKLIASPPKQYCCKNCGTIVSLNQQYCPTCGRQLEWH